MSHLHPVEPTLKIFWFAKIKKVDWSTSELLMRHLRTLITEGGFIYKFLEIINSYTLFLFQSSTDLVLLNLPFSFIYLRNQKLCSSSTSLVFFLCSWFFCCPFSYGFPIKKKKLEFIVWSSISKLSIRWVAMINRTTFFKVIKIISSSRLYIFDNFL